jgi:hypothetical protein
VSVGIDLDSNLVSGTLNGYGTNFVVRNGTKLTVSATNTSNEYQFKNWTVNQNGLVNILETSSQSLVATSNITANALFEKATSDNQSGGVPPNEDSEPDDTPSDSSTITVTVTPNITDAGKVTPAVATKYNKGQDVTITATPNKGYKFESWGDGDANGQGSTEGVLVSKILKNVQNDTVINCNFTTESKIQPPASVGSNVGIGSTYEDVIPWFAPKNTTVMKIVTTPSTGALDNCAALHIGRVVIGNGSFSVSQYYHGERVDYIDYGDADCEWTSPTSGFRSIVFNDGEKGNSNRKPARLYGFDTDSESDFPVRDDTKTEETDWQKYGILARRKNDNTLANGANLTYLKIPEIKNTETIQKKVVTGMTWNDSSHCMEITWENVLVVKTDTDLGHGTEQIEFVECIETSTPTP